MNQIAYSVRRLPYVVRSAVAGLQQTSETLEEAAQNLGAPPLKAALKVTLPLITANLIAGGLLAFAFAMLEVSDSLILAQRMQYYPITRAILDLSMRLGDGLYIASALGVWAMALLTLWGMRASLRRAATQRSARDRDRRDPIPPRWGVRLCASFRRPPRPTRVRSRGPWLSAPDRA